MKVFLSYNHADAVIANDIAERLVAEGVDVWLDSWEIYAGESLTSSVQQGLAETQGFIILLSEMSVRSRWVKEELQSALQRRLAEKDFAIIPVLLQSCAIPLFLRDYKYVDFQAGMRRTIDDLITSLKRLPLKPPLGSAPSVPAAGNVFVAFPAQDYYRRLYREHIQRLVSEAGWTAQSFEDRDVYEIAPYDYKKAINGAIEACAFMLADISEANPNVMYEVGHAHAVGKHVVLLSRREYHRAAPNMLIAHRFILYPSEDMEAFGSMLLKELRAIREMLTKASSRRPKGCG